MSLTVSDLTTGAMNGDGTFDVLMGTIQTRLAEEYSKDRIKGTEYAKVYLGSMESAIAQSIQFLLGNELLGSQKLKIEAEILLTNAQKDKALVDVEVTRQQLANLVIQAEILEVTKNKTEAEANLLAQKVLTEEAQTKDSIGSGANTVTGVVGVQKLLLTAQKDGYARKAEQDLAKLLTDTWSVRETSRGDEGQPNNMDDAAITQVMAKAIEGIGLVP